MKEVYVKDKSRKSLYILVLLVTLSAGCAAAFIFWHSHQTISKYRQELGCQLEEMEKMRNEFVWLLQYEEKIRAKIMNVDVLVSAAYTDEEILKLLEELSVFLRNSNDISGYPYADDGLIYLKHYHQSKKILREKLENIRFLSRKLNECRLSTNDDAMKLMLKQQLSLSASGILNNSNDNEE